MNFLKQLANLFRGGGGGGGNSRYLPIYVLSRRCNEPIMGQVDLQNELSQPDESDAGYYTRKVLHTSGERRCFAEVEVEIYFDSNKKMLRQEVKGGRWLTADEYEREVERFNIPPDVPVETLETLPAPRPDGGSLADQGEETPRDNSTTPPTA